MLQNIQSHKKLKTSKVLVSTRTVDIAIWFIKPFTDTWTLLKLPVAFPKSSTDLRQNTVDDSDLSGIEMESPHKEIATAHEFPCNISEVGEVCSSWIGQKGVCDIVQMRAQELAEGKIQAKSSELRVLATECLRAFEAAGMCESKNPQVSKATELCSSYAPHAATQAPRKSRPCEISRLWKESEHLAFTADSESATQSLAESLLGKQLVEKITEKNHQAPDVS